MTRTGGDLSARGAWRFVPGLQQLRHYQRAWLRGDLLAGRHRRGLPDPAGDGLRRGGRAAAGRRAVGDPCGALVAVRAARLVPAAVGRAGVDDRADDGRRRRRRSPPATRRGTPTLAAALALVVGGCCAWSAGWRGSASSPTCCPGRCWSATWPASRVHHDRRPARQAHRRPGRRRTASCPSSRSFVRHLDAGRTPPTLRARRWRRWSLLLVVQRRFPRAPGAAARHARRRRRGRRCSTSTTTASTVVGDDPGRAARPGAARTSARRRAASAAARALGVAFVGYTDNILTARAFADRRRRPDRRQPGAARARRGQPRRRAAARASRSAAAAAAPRSATPSGSRTQLYSPGHRRRRRPGGAARSSARCSRAFPTAALGAVVVYAAVRLIDVAEFRRLAAFRRSELLLALGHHGRGAGPRHPPRRAGRVGLSVARPAAPGRPPARRGPGLRARPGRHARRRRLPRGADWSRPGGLPLRLAAVLRQRRGLPPPRPAPPSTSAPDPVRVVRAQRRGQRRGRHHRAGRARGAARGAAPTGASCSRWPGSSRTCSTTCWRPAWSTGSARSGSSPPCPRRWRPTSTGTASEHGRPPEGW